MDGHPNYFDNLAQSCLKAFNSQQCKLPFKHSRTRENNTNGISKIFVYKAL